MSYDLDALKATATAARKALTALKKQGGHAPHCRSPEINFDTNCNLCNAVKRHAQATADLEAAKVWAKHQ